MTDHRPDIPDLPLLHFPFEGRQVTGWRRDGMPYISIRKRRLFGSKEVGRQYMLELDHADNEHEAMLIRETALIKLCERLGL